ncbi:sugar phosphate isomerase/epimerase family protein [Planctomycetes bacterium K23_9]|uniref:Xylose isomerase-like TIM barrel n=1 Tax=Stieleria marina TaxID=1930275 RepID=A0A517NYJ7_9BACT|nr:Xylose isomerase-like TIM barrel [Planctomycetes bacterium K23_9]
MQLNRRHFTQATAASLAAASLGTAPLASKSLAQAASESNFKPRYLLGSCLYGYLPIAAILPEVAKTGAKAIDIWPMKHGNQREQLDKMGEAAFTELLEKQNVRLGCITQYHLGCFGLKDEFKLASRMNCQTIVTGAAGPRGLKGQELKRAVADFVEKMKPHIEAAEESTVTIAIENHGNNLIESPDSLRWLADLSPSPHLAIALAPYHLPQDPDLIANLIRDLEHNISVFYGWQHGNGCMQAQPKETELLQMPGRGDLDFGPIVQALADIRYQGWTEIFMHPFPRGIPILETAGQVTSEINRARTYLENL